MRFQITTVEKSEVLIIESQLILYIPIIVVDLKRALETKNRYKGYEFNYPSVDFDGVVVDFNKKQYKQLINFLKEKF